MFDHIRPYSNEEVVEALKRIVEIDQFYSVVQYFYPEYSIAQIKEIALSCRTSLDFQKKFFHQAIRRIIRNTSDGLTYGGFDKLDAKKNYLYISNHRDIFLDAGILQVLFVEEGYNTSEITLGSNLMINDFVTDVAKINKMYTVYRGGNRREILKNSIELSKYIRHSITDKKVSSWIAQRGGRTKDGNDKTQSSLIKMLNMSGNKSAIENFKELSVVAMSVSYEYEPCDVEKTIERYISLNREYEKKPFEDLQSIISGTKNYKGKIHFELEPISLESVNQNLSDKAQLQEITDLITQKIHWNYQLFSTNYVAADLLTHSNKFNAHYSIVEKETFVSHFNKQTARIKGDQSIIKKMFLEIYANPVFNRLKNDEVN